MQKVYELDTYTCNALTIKGYIREYDISKANISILLYKKLISKHKYDYLFSLPKIQRQIIVGMMQKNDKDLSKALSEGFREARCMFCESNAIEEDDIISIRKDAIFLLNKIPKNTSFGSINFLEKNHYTAFYKLLDKVEAYYYLDRYNENIEIKGISDDSLIKHQDNGILEIIKCIFASAEIDPAIETVKLIQTISDQYRNKALPINCYREFNNRSLYRTYYTIGYNRAYLDYIPNGILDKGIDITYNYCLLQHLYKIFADKCI